MSNAFTSHNPRRAFICGFQPGHLAHPQQVEHELLSGKTSSVTIDSISDEGTITLGYDNGTARTCWHHDPQRARLLVDAVERPAASLIGNTLLQIGDSYFSIADEPTPCWGVNASNSPRHPAWVNASTLRWETDPTAGRESWHGVGATTRFCGCLSGHLLSLTRLQEVLALGPGEPVEIGEIDDDGSVRLSSGDQTILRYHHQPQLLRWSIERRRETSNGSIQSRPLDFGDHPGAALLDGDVLRIGEDYFWTSPELPAYCWKRYPGKRQSGIRHVFLRNGYKGPPGEINTVRKLVSDALLTQAEEATRRAARPPFFLIPVQPELLRTASGLESEAEKIHDSISGLIDAHQKKEALRESVDGFTAALYGSVR